MTIKLMIMSGRFPLPLLFREEYDYIPELINKSHLVGLSSVIVSGQPGTGEVRVSLSRRF